MLSLRHDQQRRASQFASQRGLNLHPRLVTPSYPGQNATFKAPGNFETAQQLLRDVQSAKSEEPRKGLSRMLTTKAKPFNYKSRDICTALLSAVNNSQSPGVVETLLELLLVQDGNVNIIPRSTKVWKKVKNIDQEDRRTNLLPMATQLGSVEICSLLTPRADQLSLDDSLSIALKARHPNLDLVDLLLGGGANGNAHRAKFMSAVAASEQDLVSLLVSAPRPVETNCITEALWSSVSKGCLKMTFLLAMSDADANNGNGRALATAVQNNQPDIVIALTFAKFPPTSESLDNAIPMVFMDDSTTTIEKLKLVEILLSAGAVGDGTSLTLVHVTELYAASPFGRLDPSLTMILNLFMKYNASLDFGNSAALKIAIRSSRLDLIDIFLKARSFNPHLATIAFTSIDGTATEELRLSITSRLLNEGASGTPLDEALIQAVKSDNIAAVEMLVDHRCPNRASVDYKEGAALRDAVSRERTDLTRILLSGHPSPISLSKAFLCIWDCSKEGRFVIASNLLDHKARGDSVNTSLIKAVADYTPTRDERLIKLLVRNRANVNYENGKAIKLATKNYDKAILEILLQGANLDPNSLISAFTSAMSLRSENRLTAVKCLIDSGASGEEVDKGLCVAVKEEQEDPSLLRLLISKADVNHNGGEALSLAIDDLLPQHVELLLEKKPSQTTFNAAFASAMKLPRISDQIKYCRILLESSPARACASIALLNAVQAENADLCDLMLEYKASANYLEGAAVTAAVRAHNTTILKSLAVESDPPLSEQSLKAAFELALTVSESATKLELTKILLEAGLKGKIVDAALISESNGGDANLPFCSLLLEHNAQVNHQSGEALNIAAKKGSLQLLEKMLEGKRPSEATLSRSFQSALNLLPRSRPDAMNLIFKAGLLSPRTQEQVNAALLTLVEARPIDLPSVKLLLKNRASVHFRDHSTLKHAAVNLEMQVLKLLLAEVTDENASSTVFTWIEEQSINSFWKKRPGFDVMELLLVNGAHGDSVNTALIATVTQYNIEPLADPFMDLLLRCHADVNFMNGESLSEATRQGNIQVLRRLFARNANFESVRMALPYVFASGVVEKAVLSLIGLFVQQLGQNITRPFENPDLPDVLVFLSIRYFPKSYKVLKAVLDAGCPVDEKMYHELGETNGRTSITALFWALSLPEGIVDEAVIETLISYGASVNYHRQPLLHLAIAKRYPRVVRLLIEAGADVDLPSAQQVSPLTLAFQEGDFASMQALIDAKAQVNDGTLHDAAGRLDTRAIVLLTTHGHDPNYPSVRHDGRGALAELCLKAPVIASKCTELEVKNAVTALVQGGAQTDILTITNDRPERSLLLLGLDSDKPYIMTKGFVESGQYSNINEDFNLYHDRGYTFSPNMYIEKDVWQGKRQNRQPALNLLKLYQVQRRFWKHEGPQPPDMINAPPDIMQAEKQRKAGLVEQEKREFELHERLRLKEIEVQERLRLKELEAQATMSIKQRQHEITKHLDQDRHQTELTAPQSRLGADLTYQQSRANIENQRNAQQLENTRNQKAIVLKSISDIKGIEQQQIQQQNGLISEERRLVDGRNALGQTTLQVAAAEKAFRQQKGGSARIALGDVPGRANRTLDY